MKTVKYILLAIVAVSVFSACDKYEFLNLERDNPLDGKNNANMQDGVAIKFDSYMVYSDNNGDKTVNKGETVKLKISLKNNGTSTAKSVKAAFSTTSSYVSAFSPTTQISYGDISGNSVKWADYTGYNSTSEYYVEHTIQFTISNSTPNETNIPISISVIDDNGNSWTESFNVTVSATSAQVSHNSFSVYSDNNGDKIVNKGETVKLKISLKNTGSSAVKSVKANFSTTSSYVSGFSPTTQVNYGDISGNSVKWADYTGYNSTSEYYVEYTVQFTVSNSIPDNTQISINISITDESNNTWTDNFNVTVSATSAQVSYNSFSVYSDNNGDKIVNKGETVKLKVSLKNTGTSAVRAIKATFSTTNSYVSGFSPTTQVNYGDISANSVKWADYTGYNSTSEYNVEHTIQFTVSNSIPNNTQIPINISIVDESGNTWTDNFNVTVSATNAQISYNSFSVYSDNNGDKIVNKGETVKLKISLKNTGTSKANSVKATFSETSSYISGFSPTTQINYGDISTNSVKWADYTSYNSTSEYYVEYTMQFTVSGSTPTNTNIPINISIVDESNNTWSSSFNVNVQ